MEVRFKTKRLRNRYENSDLAVRKYGGDVGRRYIGRVNIIKKAASMEDLKKLPMLQCHPLRGKYAGRYAVSITGFYRLIFSLGGAERKTVLIEEVSKHYGD